MTHAPCRPSLIAPHRTVVARLFSPHSTTALCTSSARSRHHSKIAVGVRPFPPVLLQCHFSGATRLDTGSVEEGPPCSCTSCVGSQTMGPQYFCASEPSLVAYTTEDKLQTVLVGTSCYHRTCSTIPDVCCQSCLLCSRTRVTSIG